MRFKTVDRGGRPWLWPAYDVKLLDVFDSVQDLDTILRHVQKRRVCIQAGGACGVWPERLANLFASVKTFEPDADNYLCLMANTAGRENVETFNAALGWKLGPVRIKRDAVEANNCGAGYTIPDRLGIPTMRIDDLGLEGCDLICLDVEGAELDALKGAAETIQRFSPVVSIEEKPLPHKPDCGEAREWLCSLGYKVVNRVSRDLVLAR